MLPPGNFLTESRLENKLKILFPQNEFTRDKVVPNSAIKNRPDFRCDELNLIIEFDGPQHYTSARNILTDNFKDTAYSKMGYSVVRIPNFIQLETRIIKILFDIDFKMELEFPHGFISKNVTLPADFCELGVQRFIRDVEHFGVFNEIKQSLENWLKIYPLEGVIPLSIRGFFGF